MRVAPAVDSARGWVMVAAAFAGMFTAFGIAYSFGAFLGPMADEFGASRGTTSVFFALTSLTYFGLGALSGVAVDRYGPRRVLLVGGLALGGGLAATSQAGELWIGLSPTASGSASRWPAPTSRWWPSWAGGSSAGGRWRSGWRSPASVWAPSPSRRWPPP